MRTICGISEHKIQQSSETSQIDRIYYTLITSLSIKYLNDFVYYLVDEASRGFSASFLERLTEVLASEPASSSGVGCLASLGVRILDAQRSLVHMTEKLLGLLSELGREVVNAGIVVGRSLGDVLHALVLVEGLLKSGVAEEIERVEGLDVVVRLRRSRAVLVEEIVERHARCVLRSEALVEVRAGTAEVEDVGDSIVSVIVDCLCEIERIRPVKSRVETENRVEFGLATLEVGGHADRGVLRLGGILVGILNGEFSSLLGNTDVRDELSIANGDECRHSEHDGLHY
ncbi:hypothetical protein PFISCL1PPCAC_14327, partial [Pristionchus fissidentatus]